MNNYCNYKNYLKNSLFALPELKSNQYQYYTGNQVLGWEFTTGVIINQSQAWGYPTPYPCGSQACSIQNTATIKQTFSVPKIGSYQLIYSICGRNCCNNNNQANTIVFELNGVSIDIITPEVNKWNLKKLIIDIGKTTDNVLVIKGLNTIGDKSAAIQLILTDDVQSKLSTSKLKVNQKLNIGQTLYSDNKEYYLILQQDGNLCIYNNQDERIWETKTNGRKSQFLIMQTDSNLCIYPNDNSGAIWCSLTTDKGGVVASIDNDGVFRIYDVSNQIIWFSSNQPNQPNQPNSSNSLNEFNSNPADFNYDKDAVPVFVVADYGQAPWGSTNFPDKTAQWIWYSSMSNFNAPTNLIPVKIQYIWNNTSNIPINGTLNIMVDTQTDIFLNKKQIANNVSGGWNGTGNWSKINFTAQAGSNLFEFMVKNTEGPAGLLVSGLTIGQGPDNNNVIFHTDGNWKFIPIQYTLISTCTLSQPGLISKNDKSFPWGSLSLNSNPSQFVNIGTTITGMNGLSFGCWFKSNNNSSWARIFDFGNGAESDNIALYVNNNTIGGSVWITNIEGNQYNFTQNINNNQWNHIVWTLSNPAGNNKCNWLVYLNGKLIYNKSGNYPINMTRTNCYIGKSNWNDPYWNGGFANFVMYQKELTGIEVLALYNSLIKSSDSSLYLYLPFASNTVLDTIINNYVGKVFNLPISLSSIKNENWNCLQEGQNYINVKMNPGNMGNPSCMSLDGISCLTTTESQCKILSENPVTPENPVNCSPNQLGWCSDANKFLSNLSKSQKSSTNTSTSTSTGTVSIGNIKPSVLTVLSALDSSAESESINLKPLSGGGKILTIGNMNDINNLLIGGIFKLRVNLPMMPPYIKGKNFNTQTGTNPNYFYLSVEKLDNNCSIKNSNGTGTCINLYADNKNCSNKSLTTYTQNNSYRLVLISSQYALDPSIPFGKNSDFTLVQVGTQLYLKNVQTGYLPSLYSNDSNVLVYGNMEINSNSNVNQVQQMITNNLCGQETNINTQNADTKTQNVRCNIQQDPNIYLMTSNNIGESSPVRIGINNDNTISLNLLSFNKYGFPTKIYALTYCNFNVKTYSYIEKITNTLGTFLVNMVCFTDVKNSKNIDSNQLQFVVELINFPPNFVKNNSIFTIA